MVRVAKDNLNEYFRFDGDVEFGTVSYGGCRCLDIGFSSSMKEKAEKDGFYILGICSKNGGGYYPTINVKYKGNDNKHDYVYVIGEYKDGKMYEIITGKEIKYVDEVNVIQFSAPRNLVRFSNNIWQEIPVIGDEEYEPGYYFSNLCYVNCNKISKKDVIEYLGYFNEYFDLFVKSYNELLIGIQENVNYEYNKINNAYNMELNNYDEHVKRLHTKILAHKYGIK